MNQIRLKTIIICVLILPVVFSAGCTKQFKTTEINTDKKIKLTGRSFEYKIGEYHLRLTFPDEKSLHWKYLKAPDGLTGKSATEVIDRRDIRPGLILMAWDEKDGSRVIDILDLDKNIIHANFVMPDKTRYFMKANITPVE